MASAKQSIGVFDSGVGGLSVLRHLREAYPAQTLHYFADQAHVPYGSRTVDQIRAYSAEIVRFLIAQGAGIIVVACNTASAAALSYLRELFPDVPIVGMEPAVKPAALMTRTGKVGVLATPATFASPRYSSLMARFAEEVTVFEDPCVGLVELIEQGQLATPATAALLRDILHPMLRQGTDTVVLGCTHYPLVLPLIQDVLAEARGGSAVTIIDPAPAVARQVGRKLGEAGMAVSPASTAGVLHMYTTADAPKLSRLAAVILGQQVEVTEVKWAASSLETA